MYPAYTRESALNEYALCFFTLLNEGYRDRSKHYLMLASIELLKIMDSNARNEFLQDLRWASQPPNAILNSSDPDDYSGIEDVKRIFRSI